MNIYYVYAYLRQKDSKTAKAGTPYYIGKGTRRRAWGNHGRTPVPTDKNLIVILETNLTNIGACALERRYIKWYGRKIDGSGILINIHPGGEGAGTGSYNHFYKKTHSPDVRKILSERKQGEKHPFFGKKRPEHSAKLKGRKRNFTNQHKINIGLSSKGRCKGIPKTPEHRNKISESNKGKPKVKCTCTICKKEIGAAAILQHYQAKH